MESGMLSWPPGSLARNSALKSSVVALCTVNAKMRFWGSKTGPICGRSLEKYRTWRGLSPSGSLTVSLSTSVSPRFVLVS
jgi:hypothetical protein